MIRAISQPAKIVTLFMVIGIQARDVRYLKQKSKTLFGLTGLRELCQLVRGKKGFMHMIVLLTTALSVAGLCFFPQRSQQQLGGKR